MTEVLHEIKGVLFTPGMLVEGEHEANFLQCLYDMESLGFVIFGKIDAKPEED